MAHLTDCTKSSAHAWLDSLEACDTVLCGDTDALQLDHAGKGQPGDDRTRERIIHVGRFQDDLFAHIQTLRQYIDRLSADGELVLLVPLRVESETESTSRAWELYYRHDLRGELDRLFETTDLHELTHHDTSWLALHSRHLKRGAIQPSMLESQGYPIARAAVHDLEDMRRPSFVWVEVTNRCNIKCRTCVKRYCEDEGGDIPFERFEQIAGTYFPDASMVNLVGFGEPLVHPRFGDMLSLLQKYECQIELISNGVLLTEEICRRLCELGGRICVSVDGARKETFEFVRPEVKWELILKRLEMIQRIRKEVNNPDFALNIHFVALRSNIDDLPRMVDLCKRYQADCLVVIEMGDWGANHDFFLKQALRFDPVRANAVYRQAIDRARELGLTIACPPLSDSTPLRRELIQRLKELLSNYVPAKARTALRAMPWFARSRHPKPESADDCRFPAPLLTDGPGGSAYVCQVPWERIFFGVDGRVVPCCGMQNYVIDHAKDEDLSTIWNRESYKRLRVLSRLGYPPPVCIGCTLPFGPSGGNPNVIPPRRWQAPSIRLTQPDRMDTTGDVLFVLERSGPHADEWECIVTLIHPERGFLFLTGDPDNPFAAEPTSFIGMDGPYRFALPEAWHDAAELAAVLLPAGGLQGPSYAWQSSVLKLGSVRKVLAVLR